MSISPVLTVPEFLLYRVSRDRPELASAARVAITTLQGQSIEPVCSRHFPVKKDATVILGQKIPLSKSEQPDCTQENSNLQQFVGQGLESVKPPLKSALKLCKLGQLVPRIASESAALQESASFVYSAVLPYARLIHLLKTTEEASDPESTQEALQSILNMADQLREMATWANENGLELSPKEQQLCAFIEFTQPLAEAVQNKELPFEALESAIQAQPLFINLEYYPAIAEWLSKSALICSIAPDVMKLQKKPSCLQMVITASSLGLAASEAGLWHPDSSTQTCLSSVRIGSQILIKHPIILQTIGAVSSIGLTAVKKDLQKPAPLTMYALSILQRVISDPLVLTPIHERIGESLAIVPLNLKLF